MAFALKVDEFPAAQSKQDQPELPSYPPGSGQLPAVVRPADSPEHAARAARHLKEAIRHYAAALALQPDNMTARLGHGWTLQQAGDTQRAIAEYRRLIKQAWQSDQKLKGLMPSQRVLYQRSRPLPHPAPRQGTRRGRDRRPQRQAGANQSAATSHHAGRHPAHRHLPAHAIVDPLARSASTPTALGRASGRGSRPRLAGSCTTPTAAARSRRPCSSLATSRSGCSGERLRADAGAGRQRRTASCGPRTAPPGALARPQSRRRLDDGEVRPLESRMASWRCRAGAERATGCFAAVSPRGVRFSDGSTRPTYDVILRPPLE